MPLRLSICMNAHDRSNMIGRALEAVRQLHDLGVDLEVVIGENTSISDTATVIAELSKQHSCMRYFRRLIPCYEEEGWSSSDQGADRGSPSEPPPASPRNTAMASMSFEEVSK